MISEVLRKRILLAEIATLNYKTESRLSSFSVKVYKGIARELTMTEGTDLEQVEINSKSKA